MPLLIWTLSDLTGIQLIIAIYARYSGHYTSVTPSLFDYVKSFPFSFLMNNFIAKHLSNQTMLTSQNSKSFEKLRSLIENLHT
jgi:hypothetical protein